MNWLADRAVALWDWIEYARDSGDRAVLLTCLAAIAAVVLLLATGWIG